MIICIVSPMPVHCGPPDFKVTFSLSHSCRRRRLWVIHGAGPVTHPAPREVGCQMVNRSDAAGRKKKKKKKKNTSASCCCESVWEQSVRQ